MASQVCYDFEQSLVAFSGKSGKIKDGLKSRLRLWGFTDAAIDFDPEKSCFDGTN